MSKSSEKNHGGATLAPVTRIRGKDLVPNIDTVGAGTDRTIAYWVGLTPDAPMPSLTVGSVCFPQVTEKVQQGPDGKTQRIPRVGGIHHLNAAGMRRLMDHVARTVIRFVEQKDPEGKRKGYAITIPSPKDVAELEKHGRPVKRYTPRPTDEPAARYMFALPCVDQDKPAPGHEYPDVLENTGLEWPDKL